MVRLSFYLAGLAAVVSSALASSTEDMWSTAGLDWDAMDTNDTVPSGIWMEINPVSGTTDLARISDTPPNEIEIVPILVALGFAARVASFAVAAIELKNAYKSCKDAHNKKGPISGCVEGIFLTAFAFGGAASAAKHLGKGAKAAKRVLFPHRFTSAAEEIELEAFPIHRHPGRPGALSRKEIIAQLVHNDQMRGHLRDLSLSGFEPELLGYADHDHPFALQPFKTHPLVPMFRFHHFELGSMEMVAADTANDTHITLAYSGHSTHLLGKRALENLEADENFKRDNYRQELIKKNALAARFNAAASHADQHKLNPKASVLYNKIKPYVHCAIEGANPAEKGAHAIDVQYFDRTHKETFGFGTVGIFDNTAKSKSSIDHLGMSKKVQKSLPLTKCSSA